MKVLCWVSMLLLNLTTDNPVWKKKTGVWIYEDYIVTDDDGKKPLSGLPEKRTGLRKKIR